MRNTPIRILLIDDDEITNYLSSEVLQFHLKDVEINIVLNGEEAMKYLFDKVETGQLLPDVILVDINMPYMDGWEFLEILEASNKEAFSTIKIFMYTSSVYFEDINRGKNNSLVTDILTKPLNAEGIQAISAAIHATEV